METFVGDTVKITLHTGIDLTSYSTLEIIYRKPDGTPGSWTAIIDPDRSTHMYYTTISTDLDQAGEWVLEAYAAGGGTVLHGLPVSFKVLVPLPSSVPSP